jgi:hypothetical protein
MTDRDHFAAAALTGLLYPEVDDEFAMPYIVGRAYLWADAMLRERERREPKTLNSGVYGPEWHAAVPNLDAAPAARASEAPASPERVRVRGDAGTGDTQEIAAFRRFVGEVMNWISEATGFLHDDVLRTDDARDFIHNACMRCWDAFDRIASPTDHGASPEARASGESVVPQPTPRGDSDRTDKAAPRPSEGTGDTPATHATPPQGSEPREGTEPVAWATFYPNGSTASVYVGRQPQHAEPLFRQPPCHDSSQKNLTLTDAEAETLRELRDEAAQYADEIGLCASEVRARQRIIDGLLERLGGGR